MSGPVTKFDFGASAWQLQPVAAQMVAMRVKSRLDFADMARTDFRARFSMVGRHRGTFGFAGPARSAGLLIRCRPATPFKSGCPGLEQRTLTMKQPASRNASPRVHHFCKPRSFTIRAAGMIRRTHGLDYGPVTQSQFAQGFRAVNRNAERDRQLLLAMILTADTTARDRIGCALHILEHDANRQEIRAAQGVLARANDLRASVEALARREAA